MKINDIFGMRMCIPIHRYHTCPFEIKIIEIRGSFHKNGIGVRGLKNENGKGIGGGCKKELPLLGL